MDLIMTAMHETILDDNMIQADYQILYKELTEKMIASGYLKIGCQNLVNVVCCECGDVLYKKLSFVGDHGDGICTMCVEALR
jgi:hypothetical protein